MAALSEHRFSIVANLANEIDLIVQIVSTSRFLGSALTRLILSALDYQRESDRLLSDVQRWVKGMATVEIDPDDLWTDHLLSVQKKLNQTITRAKRLQDHRFSWTVRWLLRNFEKRLLKSHRALGLARTLILEHDASVSPVLPETFTTARTEREGR